MRVEEELGEELVDDSDVDKDENAEDCPCLQQPEAADDDDDDEEEDEESEAELDLPDQ